jgi:uncharacterized membrane protein YgcG
MKRMRYGHGLLILAAVLTIAAWPVTAQAQFGRPVQLWDGTLQLVDCDDSVFMFSSREGTVQFTATQMTAFFAGADRLAQLCALTPFVGTRARVWWVSVDGERVAGRIQILIFPGQSLTAAEPSGDHDDAADKPGGGNDGGGDSGGGDSGGGDSGGGDSGGGDSGGGDSNGGWPGHGHGDENHDHNGPPGQTEDKPGNGNGGSGAPGQQDK